MDRYHRGTLPINTGMHRFRIRSCTFPDAFDSDICILYSLSVYYVFFILELTVHKFVHKGLKLAHGIVKRLSKVIQGDWLIDTNHFKKTIFIFTQKQFNINDDEKGKNNLVTATRKYEKEMVISFKKCFE